jgi:hypothetical protein
MIATAIKAAMRPYSSAVAPLSSRRNLCNIGLISGLLAHAGCPGVISADALG